jgi:opacity protein-like surface antigen
VRGRLGFAAPYVAVVGLRATAPSVGRLPQQRFRVRLTNTGGWTVGGGLEWAFANHWSAKFEYPYIAFGSGPTVPISPSLNLTTGHLTDNIGRLGVNYRFY